MSEIAEQPETGQEQSGKSWISPNEWMDKIGSVNETREVEPKELEVDPGLPEPIKEEPQKEKFDASQVALQNEPDTKEYTIKTWDGKDRAVTLDWFKGYFGIKGNEELAKIVTPENAPLLAAIAERTLKLNNIVQQNSNIRPEYETFKQGVDNYFGSLVEAVNSDNPYNAFDKILTDMNLTPQQKDMVFEKALIEYVNRKDMTPEARAAMEAQKERDRLLQEANDYKAQLEQMKRQQENARFVSENKENYANSIKNALITAGINFTENAQEIMIDACKEYLSYYPQKEPLTQYQFNEIAKRLATQANALRVNGNKPQATPQKKVVNGRSFNGNNNNGQKQEGKFITEKDWLKQIG